MKEQELDTLYVNLLGGPGIGKSTTAAGLFYKLMKTGYNCDLIEEYAKRIVWGETTNTLQDELYVFAKQNHRQRIVKGKVEIAISDSPNLIAMLYDNGELPSFRSLVLEVHCQYRNLNILLEREGPYREAGRMQNEQEARRLDKKMESILLTAGLPFVKIRSDEHAVDNIIKEIVERLYP